MADERILLAAGGTGGHVFPALAIGAELMRQGYHVDLHTDKRGAQLIASQPHIQTQLKAQAQTRSDGGMLQMKIIAAASPFAGNLPKRIMAILKLLAGTLQSGWHILRRRPHAILGFGGYASAPPLLAGALLRIPAALHEQNGHIGRANQLLARLCGYLMISWPDSHPQPAGTAIILTGLPVAAPFHELAPLPAKAADAPLSVHVQGGSLGAQIFSRIIPEAIAQLPAPIRARLQISQQVHADQHAMVAKAYQEMGITAELQPFFADVPERLARADLVISRAGAASVAEIAAAGRAALFIPFAAALDDHQTANANSLVAVGGAASLPEAEANPDRISAILGTLLSNPAQLADMGKAARTASHPDATRTITRLILSLGRDKSWRHA